MHLSLVDTFGGEESFELHQIQIGQLLGQLVDHPCKCSQETCHKLHTSVLSFASEFPNNSVSRRMESILLAPFAENHSYQLQKMTMCPCVQHQSTGFQNTETRH
jgi:hypothetical protein